MNYDIKQRISELLKAMNHGAYEREEVIALSLLTALAGESIFLLGLPGVGKSMVARRLKMAFRGARSFEYLMSRFSTPDEIFGPVSITKLKDEDTYERVVDGYLPTADIVFLDEIWKAGPAIQNSLLTALNERIFRNGDHDLQLPLKTIISASNELPAEGEGLEALWDRFLVRYVVEPIFGHDAFVQLLTQRGEECIVDDELKFDDSEYAELQRQAALVTVPDVVCDIICTLHDKLRDRRQAEEDMPGVESVPYVSDRRWRKIVGILRTSALLNGRGQVDPSDCMLMIHLLWDNDDQMLSVRRIVANCIAQHMVSDASHASEWDGEDGNMAITRPVGELLSPDGVHYVFSAGGEDILISKVDYDLLSSTPVGGNLTADNVLELPPAGGPLSVQKGRAGTIVLNSFIYQLKRTSPLRSGNTDSLMGRVSRSTESALSSMNYMIDENLFLRSHRHYPEVETSFNNLKTKMNRR